MSDRAPSRMLAGYWRYRIGDYGVLAQVLDEQLIVNALHARHRSTIYDD